MIDANWQALVALDDGVRLQGSATVADVSVCEGALRWTMPDQLRALYLYSDGLWDEPGQWFVVCPLAEVVTRNRAACDIEGPGRAEWIG